MPSPCVELCKSAPPVRTHTPRAGSRRSSQCTSTGWRGSQWNLPQMRACVGRMHCVATARPVRPDVHSLDPANWIRARNRASPSLGSDSSTRGIRRDCSGRSAPRLLSTLLMSWMELAFSCTDRVRNGTEYSG